jgi:hypothetical protein
VELAVRYSPGAIISSYEELRIIENLLLKVTEVKWFFYH